jgi:hypothetical protein
MAVGSPGSAGGRAFYDTRLIATRGEHERVWTQNVPEYADRQGEEVSYKERREDLTEFIRQREEDELLKSDGSKEKGEKKDRTYYRLTYSFHEDTSDEKIKAMVSEHQREVFPTGVILNGLHRNTEHPHVHSIVAARGIDGKKIHFGWREYRTADEKWARIYGREFGERFEREHLEKKEERREHRRSARAAKARGEEPTPRPERVSHRRNQLEEKIRIAGREQGVIARVDESRITGRGGRAAARAGGDEGGGRVRARGGPERNLGAEGRAGAERGPAPPAPVLAEGARGGAEQPLRALRGEGGAIARKPRRRGGADGRGRGAVGRGGGETQGELRERDSAIAALGEKVGSQQKQLSTQAGWVVTLRGERNEAQTLAESRAAKIKSLDGQLARSGEQLRAVSEAGNQSVVVGIIELLASRPGCLVAIAALVGMVAGIVYVVNSILAWLKPSESLLGR